ncbi:MAG: hypothetical protein IJ524_02940 [Bacteroidales bacterium]|nr:hypothetical protein [Bacteroidales bacterium]
MKNNRLTVIIISVALASVFLSSCGKDTSNNSEIMREGNIPTTKDVNLPYYPNLDSVYSEINRAGLYSNPCDFYNYQKNKGFVSIGAIADVFFDSLDLDEFKSLDILLSFYDGNRDMLDTCMMENNEIAIVPKWFFSEFRYVANANGMFAVGDNVFKIFKQGLVYAERTYVQELTSFTDDILSSADTSIIHYCIPISIHSHEGHPNCMFDWRKRNSPSDPKDRIYIEIVTHKFLNKITTFVKAYNLHRALFFWAPSRHNLSIDSRIVFHTADNNDVWSTYPISKNESGYACILTSNVYERSVDNISRKAHVFSWFFNDYPDYHHYYSYEITARYPGHSPEVFRYN